MLWFRSQEWRNCDQSVRFLFLLANFTSKHHLWRPPLPGYSEGYCFYSTSLPDIRILKPPDEKCLKSNCRMFLNFSKCIISPLNEWEQGVRQISSPLSTLTTTDSFICWSLWKPYTQGRNTPWTGEYSAWSIWRKANWAVLDWSRSHGVPHDAKKPVPVPPFHLTRYQENDAMMPC